MPLHRINTKQKNILSLALLAIIAMGIYPPWTMSATTQGFQGSPSTATTTASGYHLIFSPPKSGKSWNDRRITYTYNIDITRLSIQLMMVLSAAGIALVLQDDQKRAADLNVN
jgi:hypothetical protein